MKLLISGPSPWSSNAQTLGSLGSGLDAYINIDNFISRSKPSNATTEVLTVTLEAYSDSGYSNLMYTFSRSLTVVFLKSDDGTWTITNASNFDNGSVDGWNATAETNCTVDIAIAADYVLSTPYSLKTIVTGTYAGGGRTRARTYKTFTTPNATTVYAIINCRMQNGSAQFIKNYVISQDGTTTIIYIGRSYDSTYYNYIPINKWMRFVVPLPSNTTLDLRLIIEGLAGSGVAWNFWMDDFKIISK